MAPTLAPQSSLFMTFMQTAYEESRQNAELDENKTNAFKVVLSDGAVDTGIISWSPAAGQKLGLTQAQFEAAAGADGKLSLTEYLNWDPYLAACKAAGVVESHKGLIWSEEVGEMLGMSEEEFQNAAGADGVLTEEEYQNR
jgi:hypothetical protein